MAYNQTIIDRVGEMVQAGVESSEIEKETGVNARTQRTWKRKFKWESSDLPPWDKVFNKLSVEIDTLLNKKQWNKNDHARFDTLSNQFDKFRARQEAFEIKKLKLFENNDDGTPKKRKRKGKRNTLEGFKLDEFKLPVMFQYQRVFMDDKALFRFVLKSRQIGFSYVVAREAFWDALHDGKNKIFISASKNQVGVIRKYITTFSKEVFNVELVGKDEMTITIPDGRQVTFYFLSTNSRTTQSYNGDLYIDEICWIHNVEDILDTAMAMTSHKGRRVTFFSTPSTKTHPAYRIWAGLNAQGKKIKGNISRTRITLFEALKQGCTLFKPVEELRQMYTPRQFAFLFLCEWIDTAGSIFKMADLAKCYFREKYTDETVKETWEETKLPKYKPVGNLIYGGYDPNGGGEDGDNASLAVGENRGERLRIIDHQSFNNQSIDWQAAAVKRAVKKYKINFLAIDTTGVGMSIWNKLKDLPQELNWKLVIKKINYTWEIKQNLVLDVEQLVAKQILEFDYEDTEIVNAFLAIKTASTRSGGRTTFVADRSAKIGHADLFWAITHLASFYPLKGSLNNRAPMPGSALSKSA